MVYSPTMKSSELSLSSLDEILEDIALGRGVKRYVHELIFDGDVVTRRFIDALTRTGYSRTYVADVDLHPGQRIPAFLIRENTAYFGWIFYEKYSDRKYRKLWGSVFKNHKGDWAMQISPRKNVPIYAASGRACGADPDHPSSL